MLPPLVAGSTTRIVAEGAFEAALGECQTKECQDHPEILSVLAPYVSSQLQDQHAAMDLSLWKE